MKWVIEFVALTGFLAVCLTPLFFG